MYCLTSTAVEKGLPFEAKIPNDLTLKAMKEALELDGEFVTLEDLKREEKAAMIDKRS